MPQSRGQESRRRSGQHDPGKAQAWGKFNFDDPKPAPTFNEYADSWIKIIAPATCKQSTVKDYKDSLRLHVLPVFGDLIITDITRGKVKDFMLGKVNSGYAKSTASHMKYVISGVLTKALDDEIIQANPALHSGKNILKTKDRKKHINALTSEHLKQLLNTVSEHFPEHYTLFLLLSRTGMRIGEALDLKWEDNRLESNLRKLVKVIWVRDNIIGAQFIETLLKNRAKFKAAVLVFRDLEYDLSRVYQVASADLPAKIEIFNNLEDAKKWVTESD